MINQFTLSNYGPITRFESGELGNINVLLGGNGTGKSFALKALYCGIKAVEQCGRGREKRTLNELMADKLYWTYQPNQIGDLVNRTAPEGRLSLAMTLDGESLNYSFGASTTKSIRVESSCLPREANSIFIPAKEILSIQAIIQESRSERYNSFGFDDTYLDLANALTPAQRGNNYKAFASVRQQLVDKLNGRIQYDEAKREWYFQDQANRKYAMGTTSEGFKKIAIFDALLGNHYLSKDSVVFIDEPESALHPAFVSDFMALLFELSKVGIQFFIATHSYFAIKKLYLLAHQQKKSIPIFSFEAEDWQVGDLMEEMPENRIIQESVNLYREEIEL
ncbi:MAG: AAA family ATPase [Phocaeicola sp.]